MLQLHGEHVWQHSCPYANPDYNVSFEKLIYAYHFPVLLSKPTPVCPEVLFERRRLETTMLLTLVPSTISRRCFTVSLLVSRYLQPQLSTRPDFRVFTVLYVKFPQSHRISQITLPLLSRCSVGRTAVSLPNRSPVMSCFRRSVICSIALQPQLRVPPCLTCVAGISLVFPQSHCQSHTACFFPVCSMVVYPTWRTATRRPQRWPVMSSMALRSALIQPQLLVCPFNK